jgi:hypothetical protein
MVTQWPVASNSQSHGNFTIDANNDDTSNQNEASTMNRLIAVTDLSQSSSRSNGDHCIELKLAKPDELKSPPRKRKNSNEILEEMGLLVGSVTRLDGISFGNDHDHDEGFQVKQEENEESTDNIAIFNAVVKTETAEDDDETTSRDDEHFNHHLAHTVDSSNECSQNDKANEIVLKIEIEGRESIVETYSRSLIDEAMVTSVPVTDDINDNINLSPNAKRKFDKIEEEEIITGVPYEDIQTIDHPNVSADDGDEDKVSNGREEVVESENILKKMKSEF